MQSAGVQQLLPGTPTPCSPCSGPVCRVETLCILRMIVEGTREGKWEVRGWPTHFCRIHCELFAYLNGSGLAASKLHEWLNGFEWTRCTEKKKKEIQIQNRTKQNSLAHGCSRLFHFPVLWTASPARAPATATKSRTFQRNRKGDSRRRNKWGI